MMLTFGDRRKRLKLLTKWYDEGFRYIVRTKYDTLHRGTNHRGKNESFGCWKLENSTTINKEEGKYFDDVLWKDEIPLEIEKEIQKMAVN